MKNRIAKITTGILCMALLFLVACNNEPVIEEKPKINPELLRDKVHKNVLLDIRLGDGVPLNLVVSVRWKITDIENFPKQFSSIDTFNMLILRPRSLELAKMTSNTFTSVDSVFSTQRNAYISAIKERLKEGLEEPGMEIREIILSDVVFPKKYTIAMEEASLKQRQLESEYATRS